MRRRRAAAAHVVEVDDLVAPPGQQRRGLPRIAVQPPVLGTGGLTHDQHDEMAVIVGLGLRHGQIQLHVRHARPVLRSRDPPATMRLDGTIRCVTSRLLRKNEA